MALPVSTEEKPCQNQLARSAGVKSPQNGQRQEHDVEIDYDTRDCTSEIPLVAIETVPRRQGKPGFSYWGTFEDGRQDSEDNPCSDKTQCDVHIYAIARRVQSEDSNVKQDR